MIKCTELTQPLRHDLKTGRIQIPDITDKYALRYKKLIYKKKNSWKKKLLMVKVNDIF